jgi:hypothetical protein
VNYRFARITTAALCLSLPVATTLADEAKPAEAAAVTGNPPADSPFAKIKPGMTFEETVAILGKPTSERAFCTGKHWIPFYGGRDRAYTEHYFQGQGVVVFYTDIRSFGIGRYKTCSPTTPLELAEVHYDANASGIAPKDAPEPKKEPATAAN